LTPVPILLSPWRNFERSWTFSDTEPGSCWVSSSKFVILIQKQKHSILDLSPFAPAMLAFLFATGGSVTR
jgi:hypothetical protein